MEILLKPIPIAELRLIPTAELLEELTRRNTHPFPLILDWNQLELTVQLYDPEF